MQLGPTALICLYTSPLTFHKYNFLAEDDRTNFESTPEFLFLFKRHKIWSIQ